MPKEIGEREFSILRQNFNYKPPQSEPIVFQKPPHKIRKTKQQINEKYIPEYICDTIGANITACYQISDDLCNELNYCRDQAQTVTETIEVGLQLPNSQGELIRFVPRYVTIVTKNGFA